MMNWLCKALGMGQELERQRLLYAAKCKMPDDVFAIVRVTHFGVYGLMGVIEVKLLYGEEDLDEMIPQFALIVGEALRDGADVSILCSVEPEVLGICEQ
jgi:hypothetical protein